MYENISSTLQQCGCFLIAGVIMGLFYEVLRVFRMIIRHNSAALCVEDTLFLSLCAFASFVIALSVGIGYFRIYYIVFEVFGAALYFFTLGRLINAFFRKVSSAIRRFLSKITHKSAHYLGKVFVPIAVKIKGVFVNFAEFMKKMAKDSGKGLQNNDEVVYNNKVQSLKRSESGSVIKAQIKKKT